MGLDLEVDNNMRGHALFTKKLRIFLLENTLLCSYLLHINVFQKDPRILLKPGIVELIALDINAICRNIPDDQLMSFEWKLASEDGLPKVLDHEPSRAVRESQLRILVLEHMDLSAWPFSCMPRREQLTIRWCANLDKVLQSTSSSALRTLTLTDVSGRINLSALLSLISQLTDLIPLLNHRSQRALPLDQVCFPTLQCLVIENRQYVHDPQSVHCYDPDHLRQLIQECPNLTALGLPLNMSSKTNRAKMVGDGPYSFPVTF